MKNSKNLVFLQYEKNGLLAWLQVLSVLKKQKNREKNKKIVCLKVSIFLQKNPKNR